MAKNRSYSSSSSGNSYIWLIMGLFLMIGLFVLLMYLKQNREKFQLEDKTIPVLKYYYMEGCGHCQDFNLVWEGTTDSQGNKKSGLVDIIKNAKLEKILIDGNTPANINSAPTIMLEVNGKEIEYNGSRSVEDIKNFIDKNI